VLTGASNLLVQFARLGALYFATPVLVSGLGAALYGAWRMVLETTSYLAVGDMGGVNALRWTLAQTISSDDTGAKRRQIGSVLIIWSRVMAGILVVGGGLTALSPWFIQVEELHRRAVMVGMGLMVLNFGLASLVTLPTAVLWGMNLGYRAVPLRLLNAALPAALGAFAVLAGFGLPGVAAAQVGASLVLGLSTWVLARRLLPWFGAERPRPGETRSLLGVSLWLLAWMVVRKGLTNTDILVIGIVLSPAMVTPYTLTRFLFNAFLGPIQAVLSGALPGVGDLVGQKLWERVAAVRAQGQALAWLAACTCGVVTVLLNRPFLALWVGPGRYAGDAVNLGLVVAGIQYISLRFDGNVIDSTLDLKSKVLFGAGTAAVSLALGALLTYVWGVVGMVVALSAGRLFLAVRYAHILHAKTGTRRGVVAALRPVVVTAALLATAWWLSTVWRPPSWPTLILTGALSGPTAAGLFWLLGVAPEQRRSLQQRIVALLRRGKR